jgi:hypothetical protein
MKRLVTVYCRGDQYLLTPHALTDDGLWIGAGLLFAVGTDASDGEIGSAVLDALAESTHGAARPESTAEWRNLDAPIFKAAGVPSWSAFARGATAVGVASEGDNIRVTPTRQEAGAFYDREEAGVELVGPSASALGLVVRDALSS